MSLLTINYLKNNFPLLENYKILEDTDSPYYNCISYTLGIFDKWSWSKSVDVDNNWPIVNIEETYSAFDEFYEFYGFRKLKTLDIRFNGKLKVSLYGVDNSPKHAAIQIDENFWESKMGRGEIIKQTVSGNS